VVEGAGWAFIKKFDCSKNGRGAVLALKRQAKGNLAKRTQKAKAYENLAQARYRGERQNFEFSNYVQIHQDAHNELLELGEPVPETKKVQDFLSGILDFRLHVDKDIVLGTGVSLQDFKECQQYLSTLVNNTLAQSKADHHFGAANRHDHDDEVPPKKKAWKEDWKKKPKKNFSKYKPKDIAVRLYSNNEWNAMDDDEKAEVRRKRIAKKAGKSDTPRRASYVRSKPPAKEETPPEKEEK
jgi:hypothetical protein